ncbi:GNAT family N-acetyltransferase [soil metagenome]
MSASSKFPVLETERLILRELVPTDAQSFFEIHSDRQAMRWTGNERITTPDQAKDLMKAFARWRRLPNPGTHWAIQRKIGAEMIGGCGLFRWDTGNQSCQAGFGLKRSAWGQGYMREALAAVVTWGWGSMNLNRVGAEVHPDNRLPIKTLVALGFHRDGRRRQWGYWDGEHHDLLEYSLLRSDVSRQVPGQD